MALADTDVKQVYTGDGVNTTFAIPFDYATASHIKVYLDGVLQTLTTHYTIVGSNVEMGTAPAVDEKLVVIREGVLTQPDTYNNSNFFPGDTIEDRLDAIVRLIQEAFEQLDRAAKLRLHTALSELVIPEPTADLYLGWDSTGSYLENKAAVAGPQGAQGATGATGPKGDKGDKGDTGAPGANGGNGADGIFTEIASQGEAQTGTDNTKGMTPLRTKQAVESYLSSLTAFAALAARVTVNEGNITTISSRLTAVEGSFEIINAMGQQALPNNTAATILDASGAIGRGNRCELDADGAGSAEIIFEIYRADDAEMRFARVYAELHYVGSTWWFAERDTVIFNGGNLPGVTLTMQQVDDVAYIYAETDNMAGGNYVSGSYIRWMIRELPKSLV